MYNIIYTIINNNYVEHTHTHTHIHTRIHTTYYCIQHINCTGYYVSF